MNKVEYFLAHAIQVERDAARRFEDLSHSMQSAGNQEVEGLFRRLGEFSRLHLKAAQARAGFQEIPALADSEYEWPEGLSPEAAGWRGVDSSLDVPMALELALEGEERGMLFYQHIASTSPDPQVVYLAREFAEEEFEHVRELERWIRRLVPGRAPRASEK